MIPPIAIPSGPHGGGPTAAGGTSASEPQSGLGVAAAVSWLVTSFLAGQLKEGGRGKEEGQGGVRAETQAAVEPQEEALPPPPELLSESEVEVWSATSHRLALAVVCCPATDEEATEIMEVREKGEGSGDTGNTMQCWELTKLSCAHQYSLCPVTVIDTDLGDCVLIHCVGVSSSSSHSRAHRRQP